MNPRGLLILFHVSAGMIALAAGLLALLSRKGALTHRRAGWIFFAVMMAIALSALALLLTRPRVVLLYLTALSVYQCASGLLALRRKFQPLDRPAPLSHQLPAGLFMGCSLALGVWAWHGASTLGAGFSLIGLYTGGSELVELSRPPRFRLHWLLGHIGGFCGAFIAAVTAFAVNNAPHFLARGTTAMLAVWFAPALIGIPWIRLYARRYKGGKGAAPRGAGLNLPGTALSP